MLREGVIGGLLRFMGVNSKQMGVIALNCLIILAEWVLNRYSNDDYTSSITDSNLCNILLLFYIYDTPDNIINDRKQRSSRSDRSYGENKFVGMGKHWTQ